MRNGEIHLERYGEREKWRDTLREIWRERDWALSELCVCVWGGGG